jgi:outer membrane protein assembly factor BamB
MLRLFPILVLVATFTVPGASSSGNWPGFRGASAGGVGAGPAPTTWNVTKSVNIAWKTPVAGRAISSPIVWGDRIYVTTAVPMAQPIGRNFRQRHVWKLLGLDRASGRVLWEQTVHDGVPFMQRHDHGSYANATPATDGKYVVAVFGTEAVACFDTAGKLLWRKTLQVRSARDAFQSGSSPVIVGDLVVIQDDRDRDSSIAAYRLKDGGEVWRVARAEGPAQATPAVWTGKDGRTLLVVVAERSIRALDARTGAPVWGFATAIAYGAATVALAGDLVVSSGGEDVHALRVSGSGAVKPVWTATGGGAYIPSPLVLGDTVYVLNDNGVVSTFNVQTGKRGAQVRTVAGEYCASPVSANGKIYVFSRDGAATVLRVSPALEVIAQNDMGTPVQATPAIVDGTLYVRTATHLVAIAARR